jgi:hypothetical protein
LQFAVGDFGFGERRVVFENIDVQDQKQNVEKISENIEEHIQNIQEMLNLGWRSNKYSPNYGRKSDGGEIPTEQINSMFSRHDEFAKKLENALKIVLNKTDDTKSSL